MTKTANSDRAKETNMSKDCKMIKLAKPDIEKISSARGMMVLVLKDEPIHDSNGTQA